MKRSAKKRIALSAELTDPTFGLGLTHSLSSPGHPRPALSATRFLANRTLADRFISYLLISHIAQLAAITTPTNKTQQYAP